MVTLGARMTTGIGGTHKNLWFTWLVGLKSGGIDSTRCDHLQDTHDAAIVHATYFVEAQFLEVCIFSKLIDRTNLVSQVFSRVLTHDFYNP
jgi:hypothetical protein